MASIKAKKGNPFERDVEASLRQVYPDARRTHEIGYILEYDVISDIGKIAVECKRIRGVSWNRLVKFYNKLNSVAPVGYACYVIFQCNHQPCLVFYTEIIKPTHAPLGYACYTIKRFQDVFGVQFIKHIPTHRVKKDDNTGRVESTKGP
jgi:hypothetical protein